MKQASFQRKLLAAAVVLAAACASRTLEVWSKPLADGSLAVAIFSRWRMPLTLNVPLTRLGFPKGAKVHARDLWARTDLPVVEDSFRFMGSCCFASNSSALSRKRNNEHANFPWVACKSS
jgi:hypothetical protein